MEVAMEEDELEQDIEVAAEYTQAVLEARAAAEALLRRLCPPLEPAAATHQSCEEGSRTDGGSSSKSHPGVKLPTVVLLE